MSRRSFWVCLCVSMLIHFSALVPAGLMFTSLVMEPEPPRLNATLLPAPVEKPTPPPPVVSQNKAQPKPRQRPTDVPVQPAATAPTPEETVMAAAPTPEAVPALPEYFRGSGQIEFEVSKGESRFVLGRAVHRWQIERDRYQIDSHIVTTGLVSVFIDVQLSQQSVGRVAGMMLLPETFIDTRKEKRYRANLSWRDKVIELDPERITPLPDGTQDLLSLLYMLGRYDLNAERIEVPVTNARKLGTYTFAVSRERIALADTAELDTYCLRYQGADGEGLEVWLTESPDHLPVRIRYLDRKGGLTELLATSAPNISTKEAP